MPTPLAKLQLANPSYLNAPIGVKSSKNTGASPIVVYYTICIEYTSTVGFCPYIAILNASMTLTRTSQSQR